MVVLTFAVDRDLTYEERLRLKDALADAYRTATDTDDEIGVDRIERRARTGGLTMADLDGMRTGSYAL